MSNRQFTTKPGLTCSLVQRNWFFYVAGCTLSYLHPVTSENRFHCTSKFVIEVSSQMCVKAPRNLTSSSAFFVFFFVSSYKHCSSHPIVNLSLERWNICFVLLLYAETPEDNYFGCRNLFQVCLCILLLPYAEEDPRVKRLSDKFSQLIRVPKDLTKPTRGLRSCCHPQIDFFGSSPTLLDSIWFSFLRFLACTREK